MSHRHYYAACRSGDVVHCRSRQVPGGSPLDTAAAVRFALPNDIHTVVQVKPLAQAAETLADQQAGKTRFRIVLTTDD